MDPNTINIQTTEPLTEQARQLQSRWLTAVQQLHAIDAAERLTVDMYRRERTEAAAQAGRLEAQFQAIHAADLNSSLGQQANPAATPNGETESSPEPTGEPRSITLSTNRRPPGR